MCIYIYIYDIWYMIYDIITILYLYMTTCILIARPPARERGEVRERRAILGIGRRRARPCHVIFITIYTHIYIYICFDIIHHNIM